MKSCQCSGIGQCLTSKKLEDAPRRQKAQMNKCGAHLEPGLQHPHCLLLRTEVSIQVGKEE